MKTRRGAGTHLVVVHIRGGAELQLLCLNTGIGVGWGGGVPSGQWRHVGREGRQKEGRAAGGGDTAHCRRKASPASVCFTSEQQTASAAGGWLCLGGRQPAGCSRFHWLCRATWPGAIPAQQGKRLILEIGPLAWQGWMPALRAEAASAWPRAEAPRPAGAPTPPPHPTTSPHRPHALTQTRAASSSPPCSPSPARSCTWRTP